MCTFLAGTFALLSTMHWRLQLALSALPVLVLCVCAVCIIPESPHFLLSRGRPDLALAALTSLLGTDALIEMTLPRSLETGAEDKEVMEGAPDAKRSTARPEPVEALSPAEHHTPSAAQRRAATVPKGSLWQLCLSPRMMAITCIQMYLWLAVAMSYYGISFNAQNLSTNVYLDFFLVSLPLFAVGSCSRCLMDRKDLGRRGTLAGALVLVTVLISIGALWPATATAASIVRDLLVIDTHAHVHARMRRCPCLHSHAHAHARVTRWATSSPRWPSALSTFSRRCTDASRHPIMRHRPPHHITLSHSDHSTPHDPPLQELYPTTIRNTALGLCLASSRIGTFISTLVPVLLGSSGTLVVIAVLSAIAAPLAFFGLPETLGMGLS